MRGPTTGLGRLFEEPDPVPAVELAAEGFAQDRRERGERAQEQAEGQRTFMEWSLQVPEPKRPLDLVRFAFQQELYDERSEYDPDEVIRKAAQLGISARLVRWLLRWADRGRTALYLLPKGHHATEFSTMRVAPLLKSSDYLRRRTANADVDTKRLKAIGEGWAAFRGTVSQDEVESVDADVLVLDEYDRLVQKHIRDAEQRVTGPLSEGLIRRASTPTVPNYGIDALYTKTDQRCWWVKCSSCGLRQPIRGALSMRDNVDRVRMLLVCKAEGCREPLDVRHGEWVAEFPDVAIRGYHAPKFLVTPYDPARMRAFIGQIVGNATASDQLEIKAHHNLDLGEGWADSHARLTDEDIKAATRPYTISLDPPRPNGLLRTMGVDVSTTRGLNVRISEHTNEHEKRALWIGVVSDDKPLRGMAGLSSFEQLARLMDLFNVHLAVLDHEPNGLLVRAFCNRYAGRAFRVAYAQNQKQIARFDREERLVTVRRLEAIDRTLALIRNQANLLPDNRPQRYDDDLKALVLDSTRTPTGQIKQEWLTTGPHDDYAQCETYDVVATHVWYALRHAEAQVALNGTIAPGSADAIDTEGSFLRHDAEDYSAGPDDDPMSGWE